jgi:hypothetical protein
MSNEQRSDTPDRFRPGVEELEVRSQPSATLPALPDAPADVGSLTHTAHFAAAGHGTFSIDSTRATFALNQAALVRTPDATTAEPATTSTLSRNLAVTTDQISTTAVLSNFTTADRTSTAPESNVTTSLRTLQTTDLVRTASTSLTTAVTREADLQLATTPRTDSLTTLASTQLVTSRLTAEELTTTATRLQLQTLTAPQTLEAAVQVYTGLSATATTNTVNTLTRSLIPPAVTLPPLEVQLQTEVVAARLLAEGTSTHDLNSLVGDLRQSVEQVVQSLFPTAQAAAAALSNVAVEVTSGAAAAARVVNTDSAVTPGGLVLAQLTVEIGGEPVLVRVLLGVRANDPTRGMDLSRLADDDASASAEAEAVAAGLIFSVVPEVTDGADPVLAPAGPATLASARLPAAGDPGEPTDAGRAAGRGSADRPADDAPSAHVVVTAVRPDAAGATESAFTQLSRHAAGVLLSAAVPLSPAVVEATLQHLADQFESWASSSGATEDGGGDRLSAAEIVLLGAAAVLARAALRDGAERRRGRSTHERPEGAERIPSGPRQ